MAKRKKLFFTFLYIVVLVIALLEFDLISPHFISSSITSNTSKSSVKTLKTDDFNGKSEDNSVRDIAKNWIKAPQQGLPLKLRQMPNTRIKGSDYSELGQSIFVDTLLSHRRNGFFVESGAFNGERSSTSLYFELERNWTGLLIEPDVDKFQRIMARHRNAYAINACLSPLNVSCKLNFSIGYMAALTDYHMMSEEYAHAQKRVQYQCFPLSSILAAINVTKVDYFSLDIEGAEIAVLKTLPFEKLNIDVIGVEYRMIEDDIRNYTIKVPESRKKLSDLDDLFKATGLYERVGVIPGGTDMSQIRIDKGLEVFYKRLS